MGSFGPMIEWLLVEVSTAFPRPKPNPPLRLHRTRGNAKSCFAALSTDSAKAASLLQPGSNRQEIGRPLANFAPDIWGDRFLTLPFDNSEFESCSKQVQVLKAEVKDMLVASASDPIPNMHLIHTLCRLGVSHHFENEIEKQLAHHFMTLNEIIDDDKDHDLHTIAAIFQVFRLHGYNMSSVLDDTYDAYGTFEELQYLTDAMKRFDISAMDKLPADYLKLVYKTILDVHDEVEEMVREEGRSFAVDYVRKEFIETAEAFHEQARWAHEGYHPTFDEYIKTAMKASGGNLNMAHVLIGMGVADKKEYQCLINTDNIIYKAINLMCRLYNDIATNELAW
ncbi:hypothetical protein V6N13_046687 [Hibiscus sabdariffa]